MQTIIEFTREEAMIVFGFVTTAFMDPTPNKIDSETKEILNGMAGELQAAAGPKGAQLVIDLTIHELEAIKSVVSLYKADNDPICGEEETAPLLHKLDLLIKMGTKS